MRAVFISLLTMILNGGSVMFTSQDCSTVIVDTVLVSQDLMLFAPMVRLKFWIASSLSPGVLMDECSFIFKNIREESQQSELQEQTAIGLLESHHKERSFFDWEE